MQQEAAIGSLCKLKVVMVLGLIPVVLHTKHLSETMLTWDSSQTESSHQHCTGWQSVDEDVFVPLLS